MSKTDTVLLRVVKGALEPADSYSQAKLKDRGYHLGDVLAATLKKPRNPGFHRLVHAFGTLLSQNIEVFEGMDPHLLLKRLQLEGNISCSEIALNFPGVGPCTYRVPQSLSYESMDEGIFRQTFTSMAQYVSKKYWPTMTPEQIEEMAGMVEVT